MSEKRCSKCRKNKDRETDFYHYIGKCRGECKKCTIRHNIAYQKRTKAWKRRDKLNDAERSDYFKQYYQKNKDKFKKYQLKFKLENPGYHKEYLRRRRKEEKDFK